MKKVNCILLVDDDESDNFFHELNIKKADVTNHLKIVYDGRHALDYIIKSNEPGQAEDYPKPDLIFLDINMPRMNGFDFLNEYNKLDEAMKPAAVIIILTTSVNQADKEKASHYKEVKGFQNKPLTVEAINEVVKDYF